MEKVNRTEKLDKTVRVIKSLDISFKIHRAILYL